MLKFRDVGGEIEKLTSELPSANNDELLEELKKIVNQIQSPQVNEMDYSEYKKLYTRYEEIKEEIENS